MSNTTTHTSVNSHGERTTVITEKPQLSLFEYIDGGLAFGFMFFLGYVAVVTLFKTLYANIVKAFKRGN